MNSHSRIRRLLVPLACAFALAAPAAPAATDGELLTRASHDWQCRQATVAKAVTDGMLLSRAAQEIR